ncbi:MAG: MoxR family ATPase, partial [Chloroflexota bacterium]|nr:MoxR family ATPase [Chloroflexota bacterium]
AMAERSVSVDGTTYALRPPFLVIATQNPVDHEGTFPLPEAQLDRFFMLMPLGYPHQEDEVRMLRNLRKEHPIETVQQVVDTTELPHLFDTVTDVHVDESLERYIVSIVSASRSHPDVAVGASPRGSLALYKGAQGIAALRGRDYITPDDVKEMAPLVLPHRLLVKPESELRGRDAGAVLREILRDTPLDLGRTG